MTIEEKRAVLGHYCCNTGCDKCVLVDAKKWEHLCGIHNCPSIEYSNEVELDEALKFITGLEEVDHPEHYQGVNECIDIMVALFGIEAVKGFCRCNSFKYRFRSDKKNGEIDIKKAEWYESKLIELERKGE